MLIRSRALVLSRLKYNDSSDIACLFTEALGTVTFAVRISKKRRAGDKSILFQPLNLLEIEWDHQENNSISRIRDAWCYHPYSNLLCDPVKITIASFLSEFLYYALRGEREDEKLYNYLALSLQWLDAAEHGFSNFHIAFQVQVSRFLGISPNISEYAPEKIYDMQNACFTNTLPVHGYYLKGAEASFVKDLMRMNFHNMHLFRLSIAQRSRLLNLINTHYSLHVPRFPILKSIEVLREVFS